MTVSNTRQRYIGLMVVALGGDRREFQQMKDFKGATSAVLQQRR